MRIPVTSSSSSQPWSQISHLLASSPLPPTQQCPVSHNQFPLGIVILSKNKGSSSLTAVYTPVLLMDFLQAQHNRPVLGHHPVLAQPTNLSCLLVQPHISSQQPSLKCSLDVKNYLHLYRFWQNCPGCGYSDVDGLSARCSCACERWRGTCSL